jgi:hypothetical protein
MKINSRAVHLPFIRGRDGVTASTHRTQRIRSIRPHENRSSEQPGAGFTEVVSTTVTGNIETVKVRSPLSTSTCPQQLLRMRVTQIP